jgi:transposase InsO family protein
MSLSGQHHNLRLVEDLTYLRTGEGWLYLATVIDLATELSWIGAPLTTCALLIIEKALEMARLHGHVKPHAVFHSDRGSQYASSGFSKYCTTIDVTQSMGKTGVCWDNLVAGSFFANLKNEMYYRYRFTSRARARFAVAEYIEVSYNRKRAHSSTGYLTPSEKLQEFPTTPMAA